MDRILRQILSETDAGRAYLERMDAAKKSKRARHAPSRKAREGKRAARSESARYVRDAVFGRAAGKCECCRKRPPSEWHHVISGGLRRKRESVETTAAICLYCHVALHRNELPAIADMWCWADEYHFAEAKEALDRRTGKVLEAIARRKTA